MEEDRERQRRRVMSNTNREGVRGRRERERSTREIEKK